MKISNVSRRLKKILFILAGTLFTGLGIVGIFVPVLPTTPFLLLAAACYLRSSQRLYVWLLGNRLCGSYIRSYLEGRGIPRRVKVTALVLLWVTIGISVAFTLGNILIPVALVIIAAGVTVHIVRIKGRKTDILPGAGSGKCDG